MAEAWERLEQTSAVRSTKQMVEIYQRDALGGNGGENDCEPSDLADGRRRLICRGYQEEVRVNE